MVNKSYTLRISDPWAMYKIAHWAIYPPEKVGMDQDMITRQCTPSPKSRWIKIADDRPGTDGYPADSCAISPTAILLEISFMIVFGAILHHISKFVI